VNNPLRYIDPTGYQTNPTEFLYYYRYDLAGVGTGTIASNDYETFMRALQYLYSSYVYYHDGLINGVIDIERHNEARRLEYYRRYGAELGEQLYKWELEHGESAFKVRYYYYERISLPMESQNSYEIINGVRYFNEVPVGLKKVYDNASLFDFNGGWISKFGGRKDWFGVTASGQGGSNPFTLLDAAGGLLTLEDGYNNFFHNHKTYTTTKGVTKNIYKANGAVRSARAAKFATTSKFIKGAGVAGTPLHL